MRSSFVTALGLVASAVAQTAGFASIFAPATGDLVEAGKTVPIQWKANGDFTGTVTIEIIGGKDQLSQVTVDTPGTKVPYSAETFDWAVSTKLGKDAVYGIKMILESDPTIFQFSQPFTIKPVSGGDDSSSTGTDSATGSASTTASVTVSSTDSVATSETQSSYNSTYTNAKSTVSVTATKTPTGSATSQPTIATGAASALRLPLAGALGALAAVFFTL